MVHLKKVKKGKEEFLLLLNEELFYQTRRSHGVDIRSGNHVPRDDTPDHKAAMDFLEENEAHIKKKGRKFGDNDLLLLNADAMFNNFLGVGRIDKEIKPVDISPDIAAKAFAEQITEPPADLENVEN